MKESLDIFLLGLLMGAGVYTASFIFMFLKAVLLALFDISEEKKGK